MRAAAAWLYGIGKVIATPYKSCVPERNQIKCPNLIIGKRRLEPKDATIVSGVPAPRPWLKVAGLMDSEENLSLVAKALEDTLTGASLKTNKGMLKGPDEQRKVKPGSPAEANPYDVLTRRRKE